MSSNGADDAVALDGAALMEAAGACSPGAQRSETWAVSCKGSYGRAVAGLTRAELVLPEAGRPTVFTVVEALP
jgi:hypothetical protein